jgi:hypothetical protein
LIIDGLNGGRCAIALFQQNVAPQWATLVSDERLFALNNPGSAYIPVCGAAYQNLSTLRVKRDVRRLSDEELIEHARKVRPIHFQRRIRPQNIRTVKRWDDEADEMVEEQSSHDHECGIDCDASPDDPCFVALNDHAAYGLAAEDLYEILPEVVALDRDKLPEMIDIGQIAALALGMVGALTRRLDALEKD